MNLEVHVPLKLCLFDGSTRFCVDYRKINQITIRDSYPLPRIDNCSNAIGGNLYFSTIDLISGYWQIKIAPEDKNKTGFITNDGLHEFNVIPFGLSNAPATIQHYIDMVLAGLQWKCLLVYLDYIRIFSKSFEEQIDNLTSTFNRLQKYSLKLKPSKYFLFQQEFKYLGHIVSKDGIRTDPDKLRALVEMSAPKN